MKTLVKIGIVVGIAAIVIGVFPSLKGPFNRARNTANEALDAEFVVDNYKAEYLKLREKRVGVVKELEKFNIELKVNTKRLELACKNESIAKSNLIETGTNDLTKFKLAKDAYELAKNAAKNVSIMVETYSNGIIKLEKTLALVDANMSKAKTNVDTLESKKALVDSMRSVNKTISDLNGTGDTSLPIDVEKLDEDVLRESIKLEALQDVNSQARTIDKNSAEAYLKSIK